MTGARSSFAISLLFALGLSAFPILGRAQDMPPILAPLEIPAPVAAPAPKAETAPPAPSAQAPIPPEHAAAIPHEAIAPPVPSKKPQVAAAHPAHHHPKFSALVKRLSTPHEKTARHRVALRRSEPTRPQAMAAIGLPPGTPVGPPPGYYGPGPREHLVYNGPPPGMYGWGGYRGRYFGP